MTGTAGRLQVVSLLVGLGLFAVVGLWASPSDLLALLQWSDRHWALLLVVGTVAYLVRPFLLWPVSAFSVFLGYVFGIPGGIPLALAGTLLTCTPPFLLASRFDGEVPYLGRIADHGATVVDATGELRGTIAARLSPAPADAVSYGAGVAGVSTSAFAVGTVLGELPWATFYVLLGASLRTFSPAAIRGTDVRLLVLAGFVSMLLVARPLFELARKRTTGDDEDATA